jgi:hypothetical protein
MEPGTAHYTQPTAMTSAGPHERALAALPAGPAALAGTAQGLLIHEHIAPAYGVTLTPQRRRTVHIRPVAALLDAVLADGLPLGTARPPGERVAGNCRHFSVLMVAMLRAQGVPARARCGFGGYFGTGAYEDHWVCERWDAGRGRWTLTDAQLDEVQRAMFPLDFDPQDVPREAFLVAGDAWARCRSGEADPGKFGLSLLDEAGLWWIAGNLIRDVAALSGMEMLPWDVWGAMPAPGQPIDDGLLAFFDRLAGLTTGPGADLPGLWDLYRADDRVRVPATVHNALLDRTEAV